MAEGITGQSLAGLLDLEMTIDHGTFAHWDCGRLRGARALSSCAVGPQLCPALAGGRRRPPGKRTQRRRRERAAENSAAAELRPEEFNPRRLGDPLRGDRAGMGARRPRDPVGDAGRPRQGAVPIAAFDTARCGSHRRVLLQVYIAILPYRCASVMQRWRSS